jgi:hypothetical protein
MRLALEAEGIETVVEDGATTALPFIPATLSVSEQNFAPAEQLLAEFLPSTSGEVVRSRPKYGWRIVLLAIAILAIFFCGALGSP